MSHEWRRDRRTQKDWHEAELAHKSQQLKWRDRVDPMFLLGMMTTLALLFGSLLAIYWFTHRLDLGASALLGDLPDDSILNNVHESFETAPIQDATLHQGELFVVQADGSIPRFRPKLGLWTTEQPFDPEELHVNRLRSDAADPKSWDRIWGLTEGQGLALRDSEGWQTLVSETAFTDPNGTPVASKDLTCAALSDDTSYLAVGTLNQGVGLYHIKDHRWTSKIEPSDRGQGTAISQIVYWQGHFWLGTAKGLCSPDPNSGKVARLGTGDPILDLDAAPMGKLWVLSQSPQPGKPVALTRYEAPDQPGTVLMDEGSIYPDLNSGNLQFAYDMGPNLVVAGKAGLFTYDQASHRWRQLLTEPIRVAYLSPDRSRLHVAGPTVVASLKGETLEKWNLPGDEITQLTGSPLGACLALTRQSYVYRLGDKGPELVSTGQSKLATKPYTQAIAMKDDVLLIGPDGGVLHNVIDRSYRSLPNLPTWLFQSNTKIYYSGANLYVFSSRTSGLELYSWPLTKMFNLQGQNMGTPLSIPIPFSEPRDWGGKGVTYVAKTGQVVQLQATEKQEIVAPPREDLLGLNIQDVAGWDNDLAVLTQKGLVNYQANRREWTPIRPDLAGDTSVELAASGPNLLVRTQQGQLQWFTDHSLSVPARNLIGGNLGFGFQADQISDALVDGTYFYLAGQGEVALYDTNNRAVLNKWRLADKVPVTLAGTSGLFPLSISGGRLYLGDRELRPEAGHVESAGLDSNWINTFRREGQRRYLRSHLLANLDDPLSDRCSYLNPTPGPEVTAFSDARLLPSGLFICASNAGLRIYSPTRHSWYTTDSDFMPKGGRIHLLPDTILFEEPTDQGVRIATLPFGQIQLPSECLLEPAHLALSPIVAKQVVVNESLGQAAWLFEDGRAWSWSEGKTHALLSQVGQTPEMDTLSAVYELPDQQLLFAASDSLWRYNLKNCQWTQHLLDFQRDNEVPESINLGVVGKDTWITARTKTGNLYRGTMLATEEKVVMRPLFEATSEAHQIDPRELLDVQGSTRSIWIFVLKDRVKFFDPHSRQWQGEQLLPPGMGQVTFSQSTGLDVIRAKGDGRLLIAQSYVPAASGLTMPSQFATFTPEANEVCAIDNTRRVWRLQTDGTLLVGQADQDRYENFEVKAGPALSLDASSMISAYSWDGLAVLETSDGLLILDHNSDKLVPVDPRISKSATILEVRQSKKQLWVLLETGLLELDRDVMGRQQSQFFPMVEAIRMDAKGTPWALIADQWQVWTKAGFRPPSFISNSDHGELRSVFVLDGATTTALDDRGVPYTWDEVLIGGAGSLAEDLQDVARGLIQGLDQDWWLLTQDRLLHLEQSQCLDKLNQLKPCFTVSQQLPLPETAKDQNWTQASFDEQGFLTFTARTLETLKVVETDTRYVLEEGKGKPLRGLIANSAATFKQWTRPFNGATAFNPILEIKTNDAGMLTVVRPSGERVIASRGDVDFQAYPALDVGWLKWDRTSRQFQIASAKGSQSYTPSQMLVDGKFLFESFNDFILGDQSVYAVNRRGLWTFPSQSLNLSQQGIQFTPLKLGPDIHARHRRFQDSEQAIDLKGKPTPLTEDPIQIGALRFRELNGAVTCQMGTGKNSANVFAAQGFTWDTQRLGLAYAQEKLLVRSLAGFHAIGDLGGSYFAAPPELAKTGEVWSDRDLALYLHDATSWFHFSEGRWVKSSDPRKSRLLVENQDWTWRLEQGSLAVTRNQRAVPWLDDPLGPGFGSDQLQAAAFLKQQTVLMSKSAMVWTQSQGGLSGAPEPQYPVLPTTRLEVLYEQDEPQLFHVNQGQYARWEAKAQAFLPLKENPHRERLLIDLPRFKAFLLNGKSQLEFKLDQLDGSVSWGPITFVNGQFPFDKVSALASLNRTLYVGTPIGLQVYSGPNAVGLNQIQANYDFRNSKTDPLVAILRLGSPADQPGLLNITTPTGNYECMGDLPKPSSAQLTTRLRAQSNFWRWTESMGVVSGNYLNSSGAPLLPAIQFERGGFAHDQLRDVAFFEDKAFALWGNGWITTTPNSNLSFSPKMQTEPTSFPGAHFFLIPTVGANFQDHLKPGLYLEDGSGNPWYYEAGKWERVQNPQALAGLQEFTEHPAIYQRARLRLRNDGQLRFEHCGLDGIWRSLNWVDGKLAIDQWSAMTSKDKTLWAATLDGLASFREDSAGLRLDPDSFMLIRDPAITSGQITDLETLEGKTYLRLNQDSDKVFAAVLDPHKDKDLFGPSKTSDPFAERVLLSQAQTGFWEWRREGQKNGRPGYVKITQAGQPLNLVGGRFDFDGPNSLAFYQDGFLDFATEQGGWYRETIGDHHARDAQRVQRSDLDPSTVRQVLLGKEANGNVLGLKQNSGTYLRLAAKSPPQEVQAFEAFEGFDGVWTYTSNGSNLTIKSRNAKGGLGQRTLIDGRFNDDLVIGFPLSTPTGALVPTQAGILELNLDQVAQQLHVGPFPGLQPNQNPAVLLSFKDQLAYLGSKGCYDLLGNHQELLAIQPANPPGSVLESLEPIEQDWLVFWHTESDRGLTRLRGNDFLPFPANRYYVDLREVDAFVAHQIAWGNPSPFLVLQGVAQGLQIRTQDGKRSEMLELPEGFELVKPIQSGPRVILVGKHHLLELYLNRIVPLLFAPTGQP